MHLNESLHVVFLLTPGRAFELDVAHAFYNRPSFVGFILSSFWNFRQKKHVPSILNGNSSLSSGNNFFQISGSTFDLRLDVLLLLTFQLKQCSYFS